RSAPCAQSALPVPAVLPREPLRGSLSAPAALINAVDELAVNPAPSRGAGAGGSGFARDPVRRQRTVGDVLGRAPAAVDDDRLAVDELRARRAEEGDGRGDVLDRAAPRVGRHLDIDALEGVLFHPL